MHVELREDPIEIVPGGLGRQIQRHGHFLVGFPLGHLGQNPPLPRRQDIQRVDTTTTPKTADDCARDDRIEDRPAVQDGMDRLSNRLRPALLEQVAIGTLGSGFDGNVSALGVSGSNLYAGGYFTTATCTGW